MVNYIEEVQDSLEKDEKILKEIIVQRAFLLKKGSTYIFLTNQRVIYIKPTFGLLIKNKLKSVNLSEIRGITYLPKPFHSAGLIKIVTKKGENILLSPSYVGQLEAIDFIKEVKKRI